MVSAVLSSPLSGIGRGGHTTEGGREREEGGREREGERERGEEREEREEREGGKEIVPHPLGSKGIFWACQVELNNGTPGVWA